MLNLGEIFTDIVEIAGQVEVDTTELEAGQTVALPATIKVGSVGGKTIYLTGSLTTTTPSAAITV